MKDIKDYLHLYLSQDLSVMHTNHTGDHQTVLLKIDGLPVIRVVRFPYMETTGWDQIKPILRPLADMTEEEAFEMGYMGSSYWTSCDTEKLNTSPSDLIYLLKQGFDLFGLIEDGLAIDKTTLTNKDK